MAFCIASVFSWVIWNYKPFQGVHWGGSEEWIWIHVATSRLALHWMCDSPRTGCARRITLIYMWCEQAIIEWSRRVIYIVACCHIVKLCAHATRAFRSQQNGVVTRMWRSCQVQTSQKECAIGAVPCKKRGMFLQPQVGIVLNAWFTTNGMCTKNNTHRYVARTSNNRVIPM